MFLARKITRAKWVSADLDSGEIPADAVTADLRTKNNTLSFWQCGDGTEEGLNEAVLALAAAGQRVENIDIVWRNYSAHEASRSKGWTWLGAMVYRRRREGRIEWERSSSSRVQI